MKKRILFYSPFSQRSRDTETLMIAFRDKGHEVVFLSIQEATLINNFLKSEGIQAFSYVLPKKASALKYFLLHLFYFIRFCKKHHIDIVYSHLEYPSFISTIGQYFIKAKVFICRHHINEAALYNFDRNFSYRLTYKLAKKVIVVSERAKQYMIEEEKISGNKIKHINLAYDFSLYSKTCQRTTEQIRKQYAAEILMVTVCRLTTYKRPELAIYAIKTLIDSDINSKLLILGRGEMYEKLEKIIYNLNLGGHVFLLGHVNNVLDYINAADYLLHPSLLESSCVVVKEAGLVKKPVVVCQGIGDFDEFITHEVNGFIVEQNSFVSSATSIIKSTYKNEKLLSTIGERLYFDVTRLFNIKNIIYSYESLMNEQ